MAAGLRVVVVGGGLAAQRCIETLRRVGHAGSITMVCAENRAPYDRPPLSKGVLRDPAAERVLAYRKEKWYKDADVDLRLGVSATGLDARSREVVLSDGSRLHADRLLVATGGRPRMPRALAAGANVSTLRTVEDARLLRSVLSRGGRLAIVGAGLIGQEVAAAARSAGLQVSMIEMAASPMAKTLGEELGGWFAELHRSEGVDVILGRTVMGVLGAPQVERLLLDDGRSVACDHVLVAVGVDPDLDWLAGSGLATKGIPTDDRGSTAIPGLFAAGDAAAPFDALLGQHVQSGHWEAAGRMGVRAARAMLGLECGPPAPSSFWSDQYGTRIHYVGRSAMAQQVTVDGDPSSRDFTAVFHAGERPVAALIVGRPHELPKIRKLLTNNTGNDT